MENEIKVGEYVRTRKGIIGILKQQFTFGHGVNYPEPQEWVIDVKGKKYVTTECDVDFDNIVKHSPDLTDLIEPYDYINGHRVIWIGGNDIQLVTGIFDKSSLRIKMIVTKEQFESVSYKVK